MIRAISAAAISDVLIYIYVSATNAHMELIQYEVTINGVDIGEVLFFLAVASIVSLLRSVLPREQKHDPAEDIMWAAYGVLSGAMFSILRYLTESLTGRFDWSWEVGVLWLVFAALLAKKLRL